MTIKRKWKIIKILIFSFGAVAIIGIATYLLWWYGRFLPGWIEWKTAGAEFGEGFVTLKDRRLTLHDGGPDGEIAWKTQGDWFVQDMVIKDIDRDGKDELILLVWKHGSYGDHMPFWVEKNDKALKQHIFIYKYEPKRETKIRAIWMSSEIAYEIESISSGEDCFLNVNDHMGNTRVWYWQDFGLKLVR